MNTVSAGFVTHTLRISVLIVLAILSWFATFYGMHKVILGESAGFGWGSLIIFAAAAAVMLLIVWCLRQIFSQTTWTRRLILLPLYLCLSAISFGFGFGFYWKIIVADAAFGRRAADSVSVVQSQLYASQAQLSDAAGFLRVAAKISEARAAEERDNGDTCDTPSRPGPGQIMALREADAQMLSGAADAMGALSNSVDGDIRRLETIARQLGGLSSIGDGQATVLAAYRALNTDLRNVAIEFNAIPHRPRVVQLLRRLQSRANTTVFPGHAGATFSCTDPELVNAINSSLQAFRKLPELPTDIAIAEPTTSNSIDAAINRLIGSIAGLTGVKTENSNRLQHEDIAPLALTLLIDLSILILSMRWRSDDRIGADDSIATGLVSQMRRAKPDLCAADIQRYSVRKGKRHYVVFPDVKTNRMNGLLAAFDSISERRELREVFDKKGEFATLLSERNSDYSQAAPPVRVFELRKTLMPRLIKALTMAPPPEPAPIPAASPAVSQTQKQAWGPATTKPATSRAPLKHEVRDRSKDQEQGNRVWI